MLLWWGWNEGAVNFRAFCSRRFWFALCSCRCRRVDASSLSCVDVLFPLHKHELIASPNGTAGPASPLLINDSLGGRRTPMLPVTKSARTLSGNLADSVRTVALFDDRDKTAKTTTTAVTVPVEHTHTHTHNDEEEVHSRMLSDPVLQFSSGERDDERD